MLLALLLSRIRHHRCMASRSTQRRSLPLLRPSRLLVQRPSEQVLWSPRNHLHLVHHLVHYGNLDGCSRQLAQPLDCALLPWIRRGCEIVHDSRLRGRIGTQEYSWCPHHDVADVDCFWHHARFHCLGCFPEREIPWREFALEVDVGQHFDPTLCRLPPSLLLPRISEMVRTSHLPFNLHN